MVFLMLPNLASALAPPLLLGSAHSPHARRGGCRLSDVSPVIPDKLPSFGLSGRESLRLDNMMPE